MPRTNPDCFFENELPVSVDFNSPDEILMEAEAAEDPGDPSRLGEIPPDALLVLLRYIIPANAAPSRRWRVATLRLATIAQAAGLHGVGENTQTELAEQLGCTRALISHYAIRLADDLGQSKARGGKSRASREVFRRSAIESHRRQGHTIKQDAPQSVA